MQKDQRASSMKKGIFMKRIIAWWYRISLPRYMSQPPTTSKERERLRYAHLTSGFLLLFLCLFLPSGALMFFDSPAGSSSPLIAVCVLIILIISFVCGRLGWQIASAISIIAYNLGVVTSILITNPLDPSLFPIVYILLFGVLLAGALMPPIAALVVGFANCVDIVLIATLAPHTANYAALMAQGLYTVIIFLPVCMQVGVAIMTYVIMGNLMYTIHRADRAEEIVSLQEEMRGHEQLRQAQQAQLEEGIRKIAEVHARIANGDLRARVSLTEGDVLWSVAIPLNNLLNRLQGSMQAKDTILQTQRAARYITEQLHAALQSQQPVHCAITGTMLDPVVLELNKLMEAYIKSPSSHH